MEKKEMPLVSLILPVKNEGINVKNTIESALNVKTDYPFELVIVDDASTDECCGFLESYEGDERIRWITAEGIGATSTRNLGAEQAKGEFLVFCDAHLFFEDWWLDRMLAPIRAGVADAVNPGIASTHSPNQIGYGEMLNRHLQISWNSKKKQNDPFPAAILCSCCLAISRDVFFDIGGYDHDFKVWGFNDVEISIKLWLFGYKCYIQPKVKILHLFRKKHPYKVTWEFVYFNMLRTAYSHFNEERIEKCKSLMKYANPDHIERMVLESNALEQRKAYFERRKFDDDWYMKTFNIPF